MLQKRLPSTVYLALALSLVSAISHTVSAEEDNGISVGKLRFGAQSDDKWLTVDLKKTNRISGRTGGPVVNTTAARTTFKANPRSTGSYATTYASGTNPLIYPAASSRVSNTKLLQAANIAVGSARVHSTGSCWRYVKSALLKAEAIDSYPKTGYAKQAAAELVHDYGFVRTSILNPFSAPVGSVLVYGGAGAGHVEIRTRTGFVSDFVSAKPSKRPLIGVFVK